MFIFQNNTNLKLFPFAGKSKKGTMMKKKLIEDSDDVEEGGQVQPPKKKKKTQSLQCKVTHPPQDEEADFDDDEEGYDNASQTSDDKEIEQKYFSIPDDADICDLRGNSRFDVVPCFNRISTNNYVSIGVCEGFNEKTKGNFYFYTYFSFPFYLTDKYISSYTKIQFPSICIYRNTDFFSLLCRSVLIRSIILQYQESLDFRGG